MSYFPEPYTRSRNKIKFELDLSNYGTKPDLKNATGADTSDFTKMTDLSSLKSDIDQLHIGKLESTPTEYKMLLLKRLNMMNWFKELMLFRLLKQVI